MITSLEKVSTNSQLANALTKSRYLSTFANVLCNALLPKVIMCFI